MGTKVEVLAPAGNLPSLRAAVDNGADAVYFGFRNATNARNFEGLNFSLSDAEAGIAYAHRHGVKANVVLNTFPQADDPGLWYQTVDQTVALGADAIIMANLALLDYCHERHPRLPIHLSVQASASNAPAINFYQRHFGINRVILPRVLTVEEIRSLRSRTEVDLEVFAFGGLCVMAEGRCYLSSFATGVSPNIEGVCSPARAVRFENAGSRLKTRLGELLIAEYGSDEDAAYPTVCKGRFEANGRVYHTMEEPGSLNILEMLPAVIEAGVVSLKIEGRQRTKSYVATVTRILRQAVDSYYENPASFHPKGKWIKELNATSEGATHTLGTYEQRWQ
ncbi:MAG: U32 family peptidase [Magnetococcales bacterium]|nr:U32 family peptidase [Magnetococcales bacterium]MBF0149911.1 U32 family peptidase [Magnetococcales bacterium]MBF0172920.1 U32 family peptidase [Magnetococcales bacterium]MBF0630433.1 U32 family peptidase [Magnetococcales bacterium]